MDNSDAIDGNTIAEPNEEELEGAAGREEIEDNAEKEEQKTSTAQIQKTDRYRSIIEPDDEAYEFFQVGQEEATRVKQASLRKSLDNAEGEGKTSSQRQALRQSMPLNLSNSFLNLDSGRRGVPYSFKFNTERTDRNSANQVG